MKTELLERGFHDGVNTGQLQESQEFWARIHPRYAVEPVEENQITPIEPQMNKITITQTIKIKIGEHEHDLTKEDAEALRDSLVEMLGPKTKSESGGLSEYMEELRRRTREYQDRATYPTLPALRPYWTGTGTGPPTPEYYIPAPCKTQIPTDAEVTAAMESR